MKFIKDKISKIKKADDSVLMTILTTKAIGGMSIGFLLASYIKADWKFVGWVSLVLTFILGISAFKHLNKKTKKNK